ncbi:hypothetical protein C8R44DRAFT_726699 [Mycena epipterygia]|nr:hypothetical protein C8R44DRAFT_726699 [Mycena epipterygia]
MRPRTKISSPARMYTRKTKLTKKHRRVDNRLPRIREARDLVCRQADGLEDAMRMEVEVRILRVISEESASSRVEHTIGLDACALVLPRARAPSSLDISARKGYLPSPAGVESRSSARVCEEREMQKPNAGKEGKGMPSSIRAAEAETIRLVYLFQT